MNRRTVYNLILGILLSSGAGLTPLAGQTTEYVVVQKVLNDSALVVRGTGALYLIEKGVGCLSLWRYEGKKAVVYSPGQFLGVGSKLILPDQNQECRIWDSKEIAGAAQSSPRPRTQPQFGGEVAADELSLYDAQGRAAAYLDPTSGLTFYLWTGEPVAYLEEESVFGFNGKHLGWFHNGTVYDNEGNVVVAPASAFRTAVEAASPRSPKQFKPFKGFKEFKPFKPYFGFSWASLPARVFFLLGTQ